MNGPTKAIEALLVQEQWKPERLELRRIILESGLLEDVKWGKLCYRFDSRNVAIIYGMKACCAVGFLKGALLADPDRLLVAPGPHSQAMRQMRFNSVDDILARAPALSAFLAEAITLEQEGRQIDFKASAAPAYPEALTEAFERDPEFASAFHALTPGRQRGYLIHFSGARQAETRRRRVEACRPAILEGKGFNDR